MRKWIVRAAQAVLIGAAFTAAGAGIANADSTSGDHSILGGDQIQAPITVPVTVSNVPINVLGRQVVGGGEGTAAHFSYHYRSTEIGGSGAGASCSACAATAPSTCSAAPTCTAPACTAVPTCTAPSCSCAPSTAMAARLSGVSHVARELTGVTR